jgi:hypothetical protein
MSKSRNQRPLLSGPAEQSGRAVATRTNFAKLELELDDLSALCRRGDTQQLAKRRAALCARWEAADQPATADETAAQLVLLSAAFPNTARADLDLFAQVLAEDVATLKPTGYELAHACRAVRAEHDFLSVAAVIKAIEQARRAGRRARWLATGSFHRDGRSLSLDDYFQMVEILSEEGNGTKAEREVLRQEVVEENDDADDDV